MELANLIQPVSELHWASFEVLGLRSGQVIVRGVATPSVKVTLTTLALRLPVSMIVRTTLLFVA